MAHYIQFAVADSGTILIEVEEGDISPQPGLVKAGVKDKLQDAVAVAQTTFEDALERMVQYNAQAFRQAVCRLTEPPNEAEMTFTLKATGELGNVAVDKFGGEANYMIKLVWKKEGKAG